MLCARVSLIVLSSLLSASIASAGIFSRKKPTELAVRTTAYTHSEADHIKYGRKTAAGGTLKYGRKYSSAAADWSKFPLGTKFKIDGMNTTFVVDDYGSALVGTETIDIYKPSRSAMNQWGVKHVDIKILEYGDFEKSRNILKDRTKYSHVRQMLAGIDKNPGPKPQKTSKPDFRKKPSTPEPPKAERPPETQTASAAPPSKPAPKTKPAPRSAPAPEKPVIPAPPIPAPEPALVAAKTSGQLAPEPKTAATTESTNEAPPKEPTLAAATAPKSATKPEAPSPHHRSLPAPALRKVKPLEFASLTRSASPSEPVASEAPAEAKPAPPANQLRKREFRPLTPSFNG